MKKLPPSPAPPSAWKSRLLAAAVGLLLALPICEVALRSVWRAPRLPCPVDSLRVDPDIGLMHVENYKGVLNTPWHRTRVTYNSHGMRDVERSPEKEKGVGRVLALGDSFVEGQGVEYAQMFLTQAEKVFAPKKRTRGEIVKMGVGGWGPVNELRWLRKHGAEWNPDLLLVCFYTGDDFMEAEDPDRLTVRQGVRMDRDDAERLGALGAARVWLRKHIYLYGALVDEIKSIFLTSAARDREDEANLRACLPGGGPKTEATRAALDGMLDWARERKCRVAFLILPHRAQVETERARRVAKARGLDFDKLDLSQPSKAITSMLDERGVPYLDATPRLRAMAGYGIEIGMRGDSHYNAVVHAELGRALGEWLNGL